MIDEQQWRECQYWNDDEADKKKWHLIIIVSVPERRAQLNGPCVNVLLNGWNGCTNVFDKNRM